MFDPTQTNGLLMSLSQSFRTGDVFLDIVLMIIITKLVMSLPSLWQKMENWGTKAWSKLWRNKLGYRYSFVVKYDKLSIAGKEYKTDVSVSVHDENEIVINGILEYLRKENALLRCSDREIFNICHQDNDRSRREELSESQLLQYPLQSINYDGMNFSFNMDYSINSEEKKNSVSYSNEITIYSNDYDKTISFINKCKKAQIELEYNQDDEFLITNSVYYYFFYKRQNNHHRPLIFKRYPFSTRKTFDTIFFDRKEEVLATINDFLNKRGSWDPKKQRSNKLFIMLYGLPGAGKTSFIKALCNLTKRNPVKISLDKLNTNEELLDIFCSPMLRYIRKSWGDDLIRLPINKRINILEDIDCDKCNHIIRPREEEEEDEQVKPTATTENKVASTAQAWKNALSEVSLSGLLNTIDGLYELNDAMAVITTNDISKFDKALIRSGRMDIILYMGPISFENMVKMLVTYYGEIVDISFLPKEKDWNDSLTISQITPSDIEALCQYYALFENIISPLAELNNRNKILIE